MEREKGQTPQFQVNPPAFLWEGKTNRVHLHIVFVLLYSVCCSVSVLSCVHIFYVCVTCCDLDVTKRHGDSARESERE